MRIGATTIASFLLVAAIAAPLSHADDEKPVAETDVPKAVADAIHKKFPGAKASGWAKEEENKKVVFEAKVEVTTKGKDGKDVVRKVEVGLAEDGKILVEEEVVAQDTLPDTVKKAIAAGTHAKAKISRVERLIREEKADAATYEVLFTENDKSAEVTFDAAGKILEEEAGEDEKDEKKDGGMDEKGAGMDGKGGGMDDKPAGTPGMGA